MGMERYERKRGDTMTPIFPIESKVRMTHGIWSAVTGLVVGHGGTPEQPTTLVLIDPEHWPDWADGPVEVYNWALVRIDTTVKGG